MQCSELRPDFLCTFQGLKHRHGEADTRDWGLLELPCAGAFLLRTAACGWARRSEA
jgi:hypothetical protein